MKKKIYPYSFELESTPAPALLKLPLDVFRLQDNVLVLNNYRVKLTNKCVKDIWRRYK